MPHSLSLRVYYEDTDLAGIVYYANYLKFIERGRSEWVRALGIDQGALRRDAGIVFAVRHLEADYLRPAVFDDWLTVTTSVLPVTGMRIVLDQAVLRDGVILLSARVTLVPMGADGRAARLPAELRQRLSQG
ncbi:MAG: tol-pal system-associated acyl-CoA thioesterase [Rhodobacter sp.]|nr:tol-pal system-associated acyl-CoA thioesterase [Rhodobacter sp.]